MRTIPSTKPLRPDYTATYCSGLITDERVPSEVRADLGRGNPPTRLFLPPATTFTLTGARRREFASVIASPSYVRNRIPTEVRVVQVAGKTSEGHGHAVH